MVDVADLYKRYGAAIYRRARSLLDDEEEALDVMQEAFAAVLREKKLLATAASPFAMLYQIATNKALDRVRRRARWSAALNLNLRDESDAPAADDDRASPRRVEAAHDLALLTEGERPEVLTAALLYFVEGYTTEEVGQSLDLSRKTVGKMLAAFATRAQERGARLGRAA